MATNDRGEKKSRSIHGDSQISSKNRSSYRPSERLNPKTVDPVSSFILWISI